MTTDPDPQKPRVRVGYQIPAEYVTGPDVTVERMKEALEANGRAGLRESDIYPPEVIQVTLSWQEEGVHPGRWKELTGEEAARAIAGDPQLREWLSHEMAKGCRSKYWEQLRAYQEYDQDPELKELLHRAMSKPPEE